MKLGLVLALCCLLSACGGGGGGSSGNSAQPAVAVAPKPPAKTHITIFLDGDSTNWGVDTEYPSQKTPNTPAMRMQKDFDLALPGLVTVIDGSISGSSFPDDLQTGGPVTVPLATRLAALATPADIVITNSQINDQYVFNETMDQYATWVKLWDETVRAANAMPIHEEPNPVCRIPGSNLPVTDQFVSTMNSTASADSVPVLPVYNAFKAYPGWCTVLLGSDAEHPNDAGYAFKESHYFPPLLVIVNKMLQG